MICDELERLEAEFDDVVTALEEAELTDEEKLSLEKEYARLSHVIQDHQKAGHGGGPCFEE